MPSPSRRRATKACLNCRRRKVRCDVTRTGFPCTNCRLDEAPCSVAPRATKKRAVEKVHEAAGDDHEVVGGVREREVSIIWDGSDLHQSPPLRRATSPRPSLDDLERDVHRRLSKAYELMHRAEDLGAVDATDKLGCTGEAWDEIEPPQCVADRDHESLAASRCFRVPSTQALAHFLRAYFSYVHPMLPAFHEYDFTEFHSVDNQGNACAPTYAQTSLLLLQALLFSSSPFVPEQVLRGLAFKDARHASRTFYSRSKALYDASFGADHVINCQSALLLTFWSPLPNSEKTLANSSWLSKAIYHAKEAKAHCYPSESSLSSRQQKVLKRLWWCCIIRDRIMSLCLRRRPQIGRREFDLTATPLLEEVDLECDSQCLETDESRRSKLITCMLARLCANLTDLLPLVMPTRGMSDQDVSQIVLRLADIETSRQSLETWVLEAVDQVPSFGEPLSVDRLAVEPTDMYASLLWIYYRTAQIALANYELRICAALRLREPSSEGARMARDTILENSFSLVTTAVSDITEHLDSLDVLGLAKQLPNGIIGCAALPLGLHILDRKIASRVPAPASNVTGCGVDSRSNEKQKHLAALINTLSACHQRYDGVDWISTAISYFMECTYWDRCEQAQDPRTPQRLLETSSPSSLFLPSPKEQQQQGQGGRVLFLSGDLNRNMNHYLRLAATIDLSLSMNRLPQEQDFESALMPLGTTTTGCFVPALFGDIETCARRGFDDKIDVEMEDVLGSISLPLPSSNGLSGWVENDRSLYFALEMGLGPPLADVALN